MISFLSVVGLRESNPRRRKGSSDLGRGGGLVLLDDEEDEFSAVLERWCNVAGFNDAVDGLGRRFGYDGLPSALGDCNGVYANSLLVEKIQHNPVGTPMMRDNGAITNGVKDCSSQAKTDEMGDGNAIVICYCYC